MVDNGQNGSLHMQSPLMKATVCIAQPLVIALRLVMRTQYLGLAMHTQHIDMTALCLEGPFHLRARHIVTVHAHCQNQAATGSWANPEETYAASGPVQVAQGYSTKSPSLVWKDAGRVSKAVRCSSLLSPPLASVS